MTARFLVLALTLGGAGIAAAQAPAQLPAPVVPDPNGPVALLYGNLKVTRAELGEFLMARGGAPRLELLVNKIIIEAEARKRGISVTDTEMIAAFNSDLEGMSVDKVTFVEKMLPEYQKTLYEWMEDVIRPKLLLTKMIHDKIQVTDADIALELAKEYGEKRVLQTIVWPKNDDPKTISATWQKITANADEYDRAARSQAHRTLAAAGGFAAPITIHTHGEDDTVTKRAFQLKVGEISEVINSPVGFVVIKLAKIIPPVEPADMTQARKMAHDRAYEIKVSAEQPKLFEELKKAADPRILYKGPGQWTEAKDVVRGEKTIDDVLPAGVKVVK